MQENAAGGYATTAVADRKYKYFLNGQVREIRELNGGLYRFQYDAAGNRVMEESEVFDAQVGGYIHAVTRTSYDSHNRILRVTQDEVDASLNVLKRIFDLRYDYDASPSRAGAVGLRAECAGHRTVELGTGGDADALGPRCPSG